MNRRKKKCKNPSALLLQINGLIREAAIDREQELATVKHDRSPDPPENGRASTYLECSTNCPACAIERKYINLNQRIGKLQRAALLENARFGLAIAEKQAEGQKIAARNRSPVITAEKYDSFEPLAKSQKDMTRYLGVSLPTLRAFQKENSRRPIKRKRKIQY